MSTLRKAVVIHEEDFSAMTLLKPFSDEYLNYLIVVHEDAYGEMRADLTPKDELKKRLNLCDEEFNELLKQVGV
jgi:hypothetical protein